MEVNLDCDLDVGVDAGVGVDVDAGAAAKPTTQATLLPDNERWAMHLGDCIPHMELSMPANSVDFSVFSPPFPALYAYSASEADVGNVDELDDEARLHLGFFYQRLARVLKPGRVVVVHVAQIPRMKRTGKSGMHDFRGMNIRIGERCGLIYEYDWAVRKNPQALRNGTGVLTPRGFIPINNLVVGSEVIGSDGNPTVVVGVWPHQQKQMYRVTFNEGTQIDCDGNHLWLVNKNVCRYHGDSAVFTTERLFLEGSMIGRDARRAIPIVKPITLPTRIQPIDPYLVGVLLGDGILGSRGVVGVCTEREIVESLLLPVGHRSEKLPKSDKGCDVASYHIRSDTWHSNEVIDACREIGIAGKRSWEKFIPEQYLYADVSQRLAILQGLMDTDGTIKKNGSCFYASTSFALASGVKFLTESLGGLCRIYVEESPTYQYKGEQLTGRTRYVCCVRLESICPFRMRRKADKWKPLARKIHRRIVSIEKIDVSDCTCITVAAADGLFVTEGCVVTHNSQAIRTKSRELQFAGLESDRAGQRGAIPDYLIKFRKPGTNSIPIDSECQVSRDNWIKWAECTWGDIRETNTLNTLEAKGEEDTRHICPLQLDVIDRLVRLYSNPGEIVFSPFAGVGSEGYVALKLDRRFYGCELKREYYEAAQKNLAKAAMGELSAPTLF